MVEELDFDSGTEDMHYDCNTEPAGYVVTRDLNIITDADLDH